VFFGEGVSKGVPPLIKKRRFTDRILSLEPRRDIFDVLRLLNVFILPSFSEGQSNALMEAMGLGVPFVVSNCPENLEVLPAGFERFAVPPDDADGFVQRIEEILDRGWTDGQQENVSNFAREMCHSERNFRQFLEGIIDKERF
jgi:glycosyltransferase involved in cell wall biosynthesis